MLFSIVAVPIYILTNSVGGLPFLYSLSSIYCLQIFNDSHFLNGVRWYLIVLILISLIVMLSIFSCACQPFVCLGQIFSQIFCPFVDFFFFLILRCLSCFKFCRLIPCWLLHLQSFLSFSGFSFHFVYGGSYDKESACSEGELTLIPGLERSSGKGNGYPL